MEWFERVAGFKEAGYAETQSRLLAVDGKLRNPSSGLVWSMGTLETPTLRDLRTRTRHLHSGSQKSEIRCISADVRDLHARNESRHALFQVASQFNLLEMIGPHVAPEDGVTRYASDKTQGPACAISAGAATIYRNYLVHVNGRIGQGSGDQIDCLQDIGHALGNDAADLWRMRNGYALCTADGLGKINQTLAQMGDAEKDDLRQRLRVGLHWDVDVTDTQLPGHRVSQIFCSALPVAYSGLAEGKWAGFATLVLEAAYEATLLAAVENSVKFGNRTVYLTRLGGGAFGNCSTWIHAAISRAVREVPAVSRAGLDVCLVTFGSVDRELQQLVSSLRSN